MSVLAAIADRIAREPRFDIGRNGSTYLTRWTLIGNRIDSKALGGRAVYLHCFHRGDWDDALHDHPWPFVSVILVGGYWEHAENSSGVVHRRWHGPGRILWRPAGYRHRVELPNGQKSWSLVIRGKKCRTWFFWCLSGCRLSGKSVPWRSFVDAIENGALGCGGES